MKHRYIDKSLRRLRKRRDDPEKTRAYTAGELQRLAHEKANNVGVLRPDNLSLPQNLNEAEQTDHPAGVVIVIVTLALFWIAIITYFVAQMPDPRERDKAQQTLSDD